MGRIKALQASTGVSAGTITSIDGTATAKSADYTITDTDAIRTVLMTTAGTNRTVTLPTAADNTNRIITVKKVDSGAGYVIIDGEGTETIDGAPVAVIALIYGEITLQCDGSNWHTISKSNFETDLLGDVSSTLRSATVTMTIATPCVVTHTSHGLSTGDRIVLYTTGALPTGVSAYTAYYIIKVDSNSYNLATTLANASAGTKVASSGSQSGTHTAIYGGLNINGTRGMMDGVTPPTGYVGEILSATGGSVSLTTGQYNDGVSVSLTPGIWDIDAVVRFVPGATTVVSRILYGISTTPGNFGTGLSSSINKIDEFFPASYVPTDEFGRRTPTYRVALSTTTPYYVKAFATFSTSTLSVNTCYVRANRVR